MSSNRPPCTGPVLMGLALSFAFGLVGCSGASQQSGTQAPTLEADQQAALKSAEVRKQRLEAKAKLPRSKQASAD